jgi:DNA-binding IclR family transcriptional regulator
LTQHVRQASNTLQLLEYFGRHLRPASASDIADDLGWPRSSTFKLIATLTAKGFLYEPHGRGAYYPSPRLFDLAERIARADPLPIGLAKLAEDVRDATEETTAITAPAGVFALMLAVAESRHAVRYIAEVGTRVPVHASSAGRALLEQLLPDERLSLYRRIEFKTYLPGTPTSAEQVEDELRQARTRGYQQSNAEFIPDLAGVAMPLPWEGRRLSIVVVGPVSRCLERRNEMARVLRGELAKHSRTRRNLAPA